MKPAVRWLPYQLSPDVPAGGVPRKSYMERKFGAAGLKGAQERLEGIGRDVGIDFRFERIEVQPNTLEAHRLLHYAESTGRADAVSEALFDAFFVAGENVSDPGALADIGVRAGLERPALEKYLASDADREQVLAGIAEAQRLGVRGVPFFIFNRRYAVSGAQEPQVLLSAMREAMKPAET